MPEVVRAEVLQPGRLGRRVEEPPSDLPERGESAGIPPCGDASEAGTAEQVSVAVAHERSLVLMQLQPAWPIANRPADTRWRFARLRPADFRSI